jgi:hypothetical protein
MKGKGLNTMTKKTVKYLIIAALFLLIGCSNKPEKALIGSWVTFDDQWGISEIEFKKDFTLVIKYYGSGEDYDYEINGYYTIIDGILFITHDFNNDNTDRAYNYSVLKDRLLLTSNGFFYYEHKLYNRVKKTNKSISDIKKMLIGEWAFPEYKDKDKINTIILFSENTVNIREYDDELNFFGEETYPYEITELYIIIKNIHRENNRIKRFYNYYMRDMDNDIFLYKINANRLILKSYNSESGLTSSMFLLKTPEK